MAGSLTLQAPEVRRKQPLAVTRTVIESLTLTAFRNYASLTLAPKAPMIVLTGPNGAGKTNILEAISLLAAGRGMRGANFSQLQRQGETALGGWGVALDVSDARGDIRRFGTGAQPDKADKRILRLDGEPLRGQAELNRLFAVLWQTPQMDQLFTDSMSQRRAFFDRLVACFTPEHSSVSAKYDYCRRERRQLLSRYAPDTTWLSSLERKMAECSLAMAAARVETARWLSTAIIELNDAFPKATLRVQGFAEQALLRGDSSALAIEEQLIAQLAASRNEDAQSGRASHGAHKMELFVDHQAKQMEAAYCSTGEQKALLLSLLLSQAVAMQHRQQRLPVLLLDEVVAHLDHTRREALFTILRELGIQAWLTGTDMALFAGVSGDIAHYHVSGGQVKAHELTLSGIES